jgi:uncharacterized protein (TIGR02246 family)
MRRLAAVLACCVAALAVGPRAARGAEAPMDSAGVRRAVDAGNAAYIEAFKQRKPAAFAALFTVDGAMINARGRVFRGRRAIEARMKDVMSRVRMTEGRIETSSLVLMDGLAYETGKWWFSFAADTGAAEPDSGRYVVLWKPEGGRWKLHRDIGVR